MISDDPTIDPWLRRVQAMLAKAESTQFPAEAEALLAKAQELMSRHAIDEAMLQATGRAASDAVTTTVIVTEAPYAGAKASLLGAIAVANHCRVIMQTGGGGDRGGRTCMLVGHGSDMAKVEVLFSALSLHATRAMLAAEVPAHDTPRRFRHAFLLAFAARIGQRLQEATGAAEADAAADADTDTAESPGSVALVLRRRDDAVEQAVAEQFPRLRSMRPSISSGAGYASGRSAANSAALGHAGVGGSPPGLHSG